MQRDSIENAVHAYCTKGVFQQWLNTTTPSIAKEFWKQVRDHDAASKMPVAAKARG